MGTRCRFTKRHRLFWASPHFAGGSEVARLVGDQQPDTQALKGREGKGRGLAITGKPADLGTVRGARLPGPRAKRKGVVAGAALGRAELRARPGSP